MKDDEAKKQEVAARSFAKRSGKPAGRLPTRKEGGQILPKRSVRGKKGWDLIS